MNKELNEVIVLLKEILQDNSGSLLKYGGPMKTKAANRTKHI